MTSLFLVLSLLSAPRTTAAEQVAVLAGGCFWGVEAVFEHVQGVVRVTSGYAEQAEAVQVVFDPSKISYKKILEVFFTVAHDPTQLNRQGPDEGTEYRSVVFYSDLTQKRAAGAYIAELTIAKAFSRPIVTQLDALRAFHPAEEYHQDFAARNPRNPYIVVNDLPKVEELKRRFPDLYREPSTASR